MDIQLEIPSINQQALIDYAREDMRRLDDERTARETGLHIKRDIERIQEITKRESLYLSTDILMSHAADRCSNRSRPAISFFRKHRRKHLVSEASDILNERLARAVREIAPFLQEHLQQRNRQSAFNQLPRPGDTLPWDTRRVQRYREERKPEKLYNMTNLRWARYDGPPRPESIMPQWGTVTITTADESMKSPFTWRPPALPNTPPEKLRTGGAPVQTTML